MAFEIIWSPEAFEDLEDISKFIARDSEFYARAVTSRIIETAEQLADFPFRGRSVPELNDEMIRERFAYSYRLIYRIDEDKILILALVHGKRLLENVADRFDESE
jgi:plasmid stabilization system protein ParE